MNKKLIIFGNGGLASVVKHYCECLGVKVSGFAIDKEYFSSDSFEGLPNRIFETLPQYYSPSEFMLFIAIGASDMLGFSRQEKIMQGMRMGYEFFSYVSVNTELKKTISIGKNTFIMPGCVIDPFVSFADGIIAWNGSIISHHTSIGNYSFIAPGASICGKVEIADHCFIGSNSTIRDNLYIAPRTLIGAGAVITHDTEPGKVYLPPSPVVLGHST